MADPVPMTEIKCDCDKCGASCNCDNCTCQDCACAKCSH